MCATQWYDPEELLEATRRGFEEGVRLHLEYDCGGVTPIYNVHELALACRLVCDYHNQMVNHFDDDGWIEDTARIWERALFVTEDDEGVPLPLDGEQDSGTPRSVTDAEPEDDA